jgi:hypothetical protein
LQKKLKNNFCPSVKLELLVFIYKNTYLIINYQVAMINGETFATQDQVLEYFNSNIQEIERRIPLRSFGELEASNYYLLKEDGCAPLVIFVSSKTDFYVTITRVLIKKTGEEVFSKSLDQSKKNIHNKLLENKISFGSWQMKHIETDHRIKIAMRPIRVDRPRTSDPTDHITQTRPEGLIGQTRPGGPTGPTGLTGPTGPSGPNFFRQTPTIGFNGGHMMDWNQYQGQTNRIPYHSTQSSELNQHSLIQPSTPEEIQDEADYKDNVTCKICLSNKINIVCIPCGHCFCSACNTQSRNNLCALCRKPITKAQALFI